MILSSQYSQILVLILLTISTCKSSDISTEVVRQGVGTYGTELILEEISQVWFNDMDFGYFFLLGDIFQTAPISTSRDSALPDFYGCGSCLSRLRIGDSGILTLTESFNYKFYLKEASAQAPMTTLAVCGCFTLRRPRPKSTSSVTTSGFPAARSSVVLHE